MTRSPHRIPPFVRALEALWLQFPDYRFGQFVKNLTRDDDGRFEDPWNWEDGEWYRRMERYANQRGVMQYGDAAVADEET